MIIIIIISPTLALLNGDLPPSCRTFSRSCNATIHQALVHELDSSLHLHGERPLGRVPSLLRPYCCYSGLSAIVRSRSVLFPSLHALTVDMMSHVMSNMC